MSTLTVYPLQPPPGGGFHFGELGLELEVSRAVFPSDSLFAALVVAIAEQEGADAAKAFADHFTSSAPPFRLTSAFPRAGALLLLPRPRLPIHTPSLKETEREKRLPRKSAKKVQFVSPQICALLCAGLDMADYLPPGGDSSPPTNGHGRFLQNGAIWLTADEQAQLPAAWRGLSPDALPGQQVWRQGHIPRVTVDRRHNSSNVYLMGRVSFNAGCGLWFGVAGADAAMQARLAGLLAHLGDRGIGGERSSGYGVFTLEQTQELKLWQTPGSYHLLLSRYLPTAAELPALRAEHASYQLVTVGGWLQTPYMPHLRRKQIAMVAEGSVVGTATVPGTAVSGSMADVKPEWQNFPHPVYRCGFALTAPVADTAVLPDES